MSEAAASTLANPEFHYDAQYRVLICKYHGLAVIGLDRHLKDKHNLRTKRERQPFLDRYGALARAKPQDVALPPPNGPPIEALKGPSKGLSCVECGHLLINQPGMQRHCNQEHEWYGSKRDPTHWTHVWVQTFFGGSNVRFFTVQVGAADTGPESTPASPVGSSGEYDELGRSFSRT